MQTLIVRECVGIDISKATFTACFCSSYSNGRVEASHVVKFNNSKSGFNQLLKWVRKSKASLGEIVFAMEATGIYYEPLAYHLSNLKLRVAVVLPNKVKHYAISLNVKSKTDVIDARIIAQMGAERSLELWQPPLPVLKKLRDLTRLYADLKVQRTVFQNRLQAMKAGNEPLAFIIQSTQSLIKKISSEIQKCETQIEGLIKSEKWLSDKMSKIVTIKGVRLITAAIIIAETQGFKLIRNVKTAGKLCRL